MLQKMTKADASEPANDKAADWIVVPMMPAGGRRPWWFRRSADDLLLV